VGTKENPYCCVSDGHIIHHCIHRAIQDSLDKGRERIDKLSPEDKLKLEKLINELLDA